MSQDQEATSDDPHGDIANRDVLSDEAWNLTSAGAEPADIVENEAPSYLSSRNPNVAALLEAPSEELDKRNVEALIRDYLSLREELRLVNEEFKAIEGSLKEAMVKISMRLREVADAQGTDTLAVRGLGTAYRNTKVSYRARDWAAFISWCKQTDNFHCLERRPAKLAVQAIHKETGEIPPGLDYLAEQEFNVRKST